MVRIGIRPIHNNVVFTRFFAHTGLNGLPPTPRRLSSAHPMRRPKPSIETESVAPASPLRLCQPSGRLLFLVHPKHQSHRRRFKNCHLIRFSHPRLALRRQTCCEFGEKSLDPTFSYFQFCSIRIVEQQASQLHCRKLRHLEFAFPCQINDLPAQHL